MLTRLDSYLVCIVPKAKNFPAKTRKEIFQQFWRTEPEVIKLLAYSYVCEEGQEPLFECSTLKAFPARSNVLMKAKSLPLSGAPEAFV